jgi:hypothetical protein
MGRALRIVATVALLLPFFLSARPAPAVDKPDKGADEPKKEWSGSLDDEALQKEAPADGFIADAKAFAKLWKAWKLGDKVPDVDFKKNLAVVATTVGSKLNVTTKLGDNGDLKVLALATRDLRPGFRYQIVLVPRDGVKTVNGKELPKD